jgi:hypothetical protein
MRSTIADQRPPVLCEVLFADAAGSLEAVRERNVQLAELLGALDYVIFRLVKSADLRRVIRADRVDDFPVAYWTEEDKEECDYLFVPSESASKVTHSFGG